MTCLLHVEEDTQAGGLHKAGFAGDQLSFRVPGVERSDRLVHAVRIPAVEDVVPAAVPVVQDAHNPDRDVRIVVGQLRHIRHAVIFRVRDAQRGHEIAQVKQLVTGFAGSPVLHALPDAAELIIEIVLPVFSRLRGFPVQDVRKDRHLRYQPFHQVFRIDGGIGSRSIQAEISVVESVNGIVNHPPGQQEAVCPGILPEHLQHAVIFDPVPRKVFL